MKKPLVSDSAFTCVLICTYVRPHIHAHSTHTGVGPTLRILYEDSDISKYPGGFLVFKKGDTHMLYLRFPLES